MGINVILNLPEGGNQINRAVMLLIYRKIYTNDIHPHCVMPVKKCDLYNIYNGILFMETHLSKRAQLGNRILKLSQCETILQIIVSSSSLWK